MVETPAALRNRFHYNELENAVNYKKWNKNVHKHL